MVKRPLRTRINPQSLTIMGVPKRFVKMSIDDFKTYGDDGLEEIKDFCSDYIDNIDTNIYEGNGIFFCGGNGVGKTMLASIILKEAYIHRYSGYRVTFSRYLTEYTSSWGKSADEREEIEQEVFEKYKGAEILVLEEIGKEIESKIAKPALEDLLRYREEQGLVTIICCNLTPKKVAEVYGSSILSLIQGTTTYLKVIGKDRRKGRVKK